MDRIKNMSGPGIPRVFYLLGTLTCIHLAIVNLVNASCSEIPFILTSTHSNPSGRHFLPAKTRNSFDKSFVKYGK